MEINMKRIGLLLWAIGIFSLSAQAQEIFKGKIVYKTTYEGDIEAYKSMLPASSTLYFGSGKFKRASDGTTASMIGEVVSTGSDSVLYFVFKSEKTVYKVTASKFKETFEANSSVTTTTTATGKTAKILGYTCKEYKITIQSGANTTENYVWTTDQWEVKAPKGGKYTGEMLSSGVKGVPLKRISTISLMGITVKVTEVATELDTNISDNEFVIPADYKMIEDLPPMVKMLDSLK